MSVGLPSILPREVLKWLQSLDLSYSVKNPRRDFANGFLFAEIFSRYFQFDIQLHSFENGSSLKRKLDNWALIEKFCHKRSVPLTKEIIDGVIHNKDGAATEAVEKIYSFLTSRTVPIKGNGGESPIPGYAKATTSNLIKENIRNSEVEVSEIIATQAKAAQIVEAHVEIQKQQRRMDLAAVADKRHERVETRKVIQSEDQPLMQFNKVEIKAVGKNDLAKSKGRASMIQGSDGPNNQNEVGVSVQPHAPVKPVLDILSQALMIKLQGHESARALMGKRNAIVVFIEEILSSTSAELVAEIFEDLLSKCGAAVVSTIHASPREFWVLLSTFLPSLIVSAHGEARTAAIATFLSSLGVQAVAKDPRGTWEMFVDFGLTKASTLLKKTKVGRNSILQVVYSFCPNEISPHIAAIKALQDTLGDQLLFMQCLGVLVTLEHTFDEDMLDLYLYYCVLGMGMPSQQLRAVCLSILPIAANQNVQLVLGKLDLLEHSGKSNWWEVHAQLVNVYATLLSLIDKDHADSGRVCFLLGELLAKSHNQDVLKIALSALAPELVNHPKLKPIYAKALLDIPLVCLKGNEMVAGLLKASNIHSLSIPKDMLVNHYRLISLDQEWHAPSVALGVAAEIQARGLVNLTAQHLEIFRTCLNSTVTMSTEDKSEFAQVFHGIKDFLYIALCDVDICVLAKDVLLSLATHLDPNVIIQSSDTMLKALKLLHPKGDANCKAEAVLFLHEMIKFFNTNGQSEAERSCSELAVELAQ